MAAFALAPVVDCAKAQGEVETLICSDPSLGTLDRRLDEVYRAATAKAAGEVATRLRTEQRGWVTGRNDYWKATDKTWMTASWTVHTVKACIEAQYRPRTSELQSVWRLVSEKTVLYACQDNPANEVVANVFETDPATIRLERGNRTVTMWLVRDGRPGYYEGQNVSLVHKGNEVTVNWLNTATGQSEEMQCRVRSARSVASLRADPRFPALMAEG